MGEFTDIVGNLGDAARSLLGELTSIWIPIQLALIAGAAALAAVVALLVRTRIDLVASTMGWPAMLRLVVRTVVANLGMVVFAILVGSLRVTMLALTLPQRSSLLGIATSLAVAWVVINLVASFIATVSFTAWSPSRPGPWRR